MNLVILHGNLTKDVELKFTQGAEPMAIGRSTVAVKREGKQKEGAPTSDFINLVAFGKTAEFMEKYFKKGSAIIVTGRLTTGSYTNKDGQKVYTTDVTVEKVEFAGGKKEGGEQSTATQAKPQAKPQQFVPVEPDDLELPF